MIWAHLHPYSGVDFCGFFARLFARLWGGVLGGWSGELASDEIQLLVLLTFALSAAFVGSLLVLRRVAMLATSISHTVLLGIVLAYLLCQRTMEMEGIALLPAGVLPLAVLTTAFFTAFTTQFLTRTVGLHQEESTGIVFTAFFALGILLVSLFARNSHLGLELIAGSIDVLSIKELQGTSWVLVGNLVITCLLYRSYLVSSFDSGFARTVGIRINLYEYLLMLQSAATIVTGFQVLGVVMVLAFLVLPPLAVRPFIRSLPALWIGSALFSALTSCVGVALSRHFLTFAPYPLSTGGVIVALQGGGWLSLWGCRWIVGNLWEVFSSKKLNIGQRAKI